MMYMMTDEEYARANKEAKDARVKPTADNPLGVGSALDVQVGGDHYKDMAIQPMEYNVRNNIPFAEGNVIKYVSRWRRKGGVNDLRKARHVLDILIELEEGGK